MNASVKALAAVAILVSSTTPLYVYADSDYGWIYRVQASMDHRIAQNATAISDLTANQGALDKRLSDNEYFTEEALSQATTGLEVSGDNTRRLDELDVKTDSHGARIGTLEDKASNQGSRIDELETTTVRQPALENESKARIKESEDRIEGDAKLNQRTDEAFGVLANHEGRIVDLEGRSDATDGKLNIIQNNAARTDNKLIETNRHVNTVEDTAKRALSGVGTVKKSVADNATAIDSVKADQKTDHDKIEFLDQRHVDTANRIDGLDRKTDQTANDASYAVGKVDYLDKEHIATNNQVYQQADHLKALDADQIRQDDAINSKASKSTVDTLTGRVGDNESRTTMVEGRTTSLETRATNNEGRTSSLEKRADKGEARTTTLESRADKTDLRTSSLESRTDRNEARTGVIESRTTIVEGRATKLEAGQAETNRQVESNRQNIQKVDNTANAALKVGNSAYTQAQRNTLRLDGHDADIATLNRSVQAVDQKSIERSRQTLDQANAFTQSKFDQVNSRVDKVQKEERAGIAGVAAIAGMPAIPGYKWQTSFGAGSFKDASAVAMGVIYQPTPTDAFKFAGALTNGGADNAVFSGGFTHAW